MTSEKSIANMTFEEALSELEELISGIENGKQDLNTTINSFERGILLKKHCDSKLTEAKLKIEKITKSSDGSIKTEEANI